MSVDLLGVAIKMAAIIPAITIHEYCHAKFADMAGDDTPRSQGRVTLNPLAHLDPLGTIMMLISSLAGVGIGWGRPVLVDQRKLRNRRVDNFILTIAGPLSNLLQAIFWAILLRFVLVPVGSELRGSGLFELVTNFALVSVLINTGLFVFNLVPLGPLDGHWLVSELLPDKQRFAWLNFCHGPGMFIFLALVLIPPGPYDVLGNFMYPFIKRIVSVLLGIPSDVL
ncbi:MAG: site-2 protease family protein [Fimbriimonadaceae bacterium]|nr:site-2 protease family protein [Fimbriimonadaceae bacterium]MCE2767309.1 site-2 protease family protein [Fimbriimonadaceae bacterium]